MSVVSSLLGGLFSGSDPVKDAQRRDRINLTYQGAMRGDPSEISCLRDMAQGVSSGPNDPRQCAVGSSWAATYAKAKWIEYQARVAAGSVGGVLIGESDLPSRISATVAGLSPVVIGGGLLIAYLVFRRRGR